MRNFAAEFPIKGKEMLEWWNGRHEGLKIPWPLRLCGFESRFEHKELSAKIAGDSFFCVPGNPGVMVNPGVMGKLDLLD